MMVERRVYVGLGSNLDQPEQQIREALRRLAETPGLRIDAVSRLFSTPPWGLIEQPTFVNAVARLYSALAPHDLLRHLLRVEQAMGRQRSQRWGPRRIDLDLLHVEGETVADEQLQLPHPRIGERAFVLVPWLDLEPDAELPGLGRLAERTDWVDCSGVEPLP